MSCLEVLQTGFLLFRVPERLLYKDKNTVSCTYRVNENQDILISVYQSG